MLTAKQEVEWESVVTDARQPQTGWVYLDSPLARAVDDERRLLLAVAKAGQAWFAARRVETATYDTEGSGPDDWVRAHAAWVRAEDELERCLAALGKGGSS